MSVTTTLYDEITGLLIREAETNKYTDITPDTLREFYTDLPKSDAPPRANASHRQTPTQNRDNRSFTAPAPAQNINTPSPQKTNIDISSLTLDQLRDVVAGCTKCKLCQRRTQTVFGVGNPDADLMFIGEGPGRDEDIQGIPFVGLAGQLLTKMINAMQFSRESVYIANIVKCRPPNNRNPEPDEMSICLPYLNRQIELVKPKVLVGLGAVPLGALLKKSGITRERGKWSEYMGIKMMPTYHPAYLLRNPEAKKDAWADLQAVMAIFGKAHAKHR